MNILLKSMESVSSNCRTLDSSTSPTESSYQYLLLKVRDELRLKCSRKRSSDDFHYWFILFYFFCHCRCLVVPLTLMLRVRSC